MDKGREGVKNPENFANVLYEWSLTLRELICSDLVPGPNPDFVLFLRISRPRHVVRTQCFDELNKTYINLTSLSFCLRVRSGQIRTLSVSADELGGRNENKPSDVI